jgi:hypothetical protein
MLPFDNSAHDFDADEETRELELRELVREPITR